MGKFYLRVRPEVKPCFVTFSLCMISMCKALRQSSLSLPVCKMVIQSFSFRALGSIGIQVYGTCSTALGAEEGREPTFCVASGWRGSGNSPGEGLGCVPGRGLTSSQGYHRGHSPGAHRHGLICSYILCSLVSEGAWGWGGVGARDSGVFWARRPTGQLSICVLCT